MRVLVTGASGFLGSQILSELIAYGYEVKALVRQLNNKFPLEVDQIVINDISKLKSSSSDYDDIFENVDSVIHTAGLAHILKSNSKYNSEDFIKINRDATIELAKISSKSVKRFVFISSIGVNGTYNSSPFLENDTPYPSGDYATSKYQAELGLFDIVKNSSMEVVIIRPPLIYGPAAKGNFHTLAKLIEKGIPLPLGSVSNKRSLIGLDNLVNFVIFCADFNKTPKAANQLFLISDGEDVSTTELLVRMFTSFGMRPRLVKIPIPFLSFVVNIFGKSKIDRQLFKSVQIDNSKARTLLGWTPVTSMNEQLRKVAKYYSVK